MWRIRWLISNRSTLILLWARFFANVLVCCVWSLATCVSPACAQLKRAMARHKAQEQENGKWERRGKREPNDKKKITHRPHSSNTKIQQKYSIHAIHSNWQRVENKIYTRNYHDNSETVENTRQTKQQYKCEAKTEFFEIDSISLAPIEWAIALNFYYQFMWRFWLTTWLSLFFFHRKKYIHRVYRWCCWLCDASTIY